MKTTFDSSPDGAVTAVTVVVVLLVGVIGAALLVASVNRPASLGLRIAIGGSGVVCFAILAITYGYTPRRFVLSAEDVVVERGVGNIRIPLRSIRKVEVLSSEFRPTWRTFGSGGLFGVFGQFASPMGSVTLYGRRSEGGVMLETECGRIVLRPDEPTALVESLSAALVKQRGGTGGPDGPRGEL